MARRISSRPSHNPAVGRTGSGRHDPVRRVTRHCWRAPAQRSHSRCSPNSRLCLVASMAFHRATRAAKLCRLMTSIVRSAACRWRSRPSRRRSRRTSPTCAPMTRISRNGGRPSRRSPESASRSPGPAMRGIQTTAIARSISNYWNRCSGSKAFPSSASSANCATADAALLARHANVTHLGAGLADMADTAAVDRPRRSHNLGRHISGSPRRRHGTRGMGVAALFSGLAMDTHRHAQPVVSAGAAVSSARARRLAKRHCGNARCAAAHRQNRISRSIRPRRG